MQLMIKACLYLKSSIAPLFSLYHKRRYVLLFFLVIHLPLFASENIPEHDTVTQKIWPIVEKQFENSIDDDSLQFMFALVKGYCEGNYNCIFNTYDLLRENFERKKSNLIISISISKEMLRISQEQQLEHKARSHSNLYRYYHALGVKKLSTIYLDSCILLYQQLGDDSRYIISKEAKIEALLGVEKIDNTVLKMDLLLEEAKEKNNLSLEYFILRKVVFIKTKAQRYEEVETHLKEMQDYLFSDTINTFTTFDTMEFFRSKGLLYFDQNQWKKAEKYYFKALPIAIKIPDKWREIHTLYKLSEINWNLNNKPTAKTYLENALKESSIIEFHDLLMKGYSLKKRYAEQEQDYKTAYLSQKKEDFHNEELNKRAAGFNVENYYLQIEKEKLEAEKKNNELQLNLDNNHLRSTITTLSFFLILSSSFIFAFFHIRKRKNKLEAQNKIIKKQTEELSKLDIAKSRFFANASHEFRTPLALMFGPINTLLKENQLNERQKELLQLTHKNGEQLKNLVSDILDLSKSELGILELNQKPVLLYPCLMNCFNQFVEFAQQKNINYSYEAEIHADIVVNIDEKKCKQIITNILLNSFKFTPATGTIRCRAYFSDENIIISIADTGEGIHPNDLPHLFDRYFQTNQTNKSAEGGSGIGLALCKEYINLFNGKIDVESTLGEGTVFSIVIPLEIVKKTNVGQASPNNKNSIIKIPSKKKLQNKPNESLSQNNKKPILLLVEDNLDLQKYYSLILQNRYQILIANNGAEALQLLFPSNSSNINYQNIDLIISDLMMPIMDGYELLEKLKSSDKTRHIPTIVVTGKAEETDKIEVLRIGVDSYITKPFIEDELFIQINNLLKNQKEKLHFHQEEIQKNNIFLSQEDAQWLKDFENYIEENIKNELLSLTYLATTFAMSESTLTRQLKKLTGLTPKKYLQEMRLEKARKLLDKNNDWTITKIATEVGYSDAKYFSKSFKQRFGKLPSEYNT